MHRIFLCLNEFLWSQKQGLLTWPAYNLEFLQEYVEVNKTKFLQIGLTVTLRHADEDICAVWLSLLFSSDFLSVQDTDVAMPKDSEVSLWQFKMIQNWIKYKFCLHIFRCEKLKSIEQYFHICSKCSRCCTHTKMLRCFVTLVTSNNSDLWCSLKWRLFNWLIFLLA